LAILSFGISGSPVEISFSILAPSVLLKAPSSPVKARLGCARGYRVSSWIALQGRIGPLNGFEGVSAPGWSFWGLSARLALSPTRAPSIPYASVRYHPTHPPNHARRAPTITCALRAKGPRTHTTGPYASTAGPAFILTYPTNSLDFTR
jgi:hypothetical protein